MRDNYVRRLLFASLMLPGLSRAPLEAAGSRDMSSDQYQVPGTTGISLLSLRQRNAIFSCMLSAIRLLSLAS